MGKGLNRPAVVTMFDVFPIEKATGNFCRDPARLAIYAERVSRSWPKPKSHLFMIWMLMNVAQVKENTERMGAKLVSYDKQTGTWIFEVEHFSR